MKEAGFTNVKVIGLAKQTFYNKRLTAPAVEIQGVKPASP
jgi:hypothetical protein